MKKTIWKSEVRFFQFSLWWLAFIPCLFVFAWNLGLACITDFIKLGHIDFSNISVIDNAINTCKYYLAFIGVIYVILSFFMLFLNGLRDKINGIVDYVFAKLPMWDDDSFDYGQKKSLCNCDLFENNNYDNSPDCSIFIDNPFHYTK